MRYYPIMCLSLFVLGTSKADDEAAKLRAKVKAVPMTQKVQLSDDEWRKIIAPAQFVVLRQAATEPPFQNEYARTHNSGTYLCAACGSALFSSTTKFESGTGWPSFYAPLSKEKIQVAADKSNGPSREEVRCARCGSHLGHVFNDGPAPTRLRNCLTSAALKLVEK